MNLFSTAILYGILDLGYVSRADAKTMAARMTEGGVDLLQLRAKSLPEAEIRSLAAEIHEVTRAAGVPLVINDHPRIAGEIGAEGAHIGQDDFSVSEARALAGSGCFIGKSTHSVRQAIEAEREGADYIGFGPLFATPTKPDYIPIGINAIRQVHETVQIPIFCIGGIKLENLDRVLEAGVSRVVIVSGILQAADPAAHCRAVKTKISESAAPALSR